MSTLPTFTEAINDAFVETWYEIRPTAIDNILDATPVWAALKMKGAFDTQTGGELITRTIKYGNVDSEAVERGDVSATGDPELETMARWTFRYISTHVQRNIFSDRENSGKFKIKDYVQKRIMDARDSQAQKFETRLMATEVTAEGGKEIQGLNDLVPTYANRATGTYGLISRSNSWWQPNYKALSDPIEVNLVSDMRNLFNTCQANMDAPDLIVSDQDLFEMYEDFGLDATQVAASATLIDLGFQALKFKGADMVWTPNQTSNNMQFLNTKFIEVIYDPGMWFDFTGFKATAREFELLGQMISALNVISTQLRRHGRLYES